MWLSLPRVEVRPQSDKNHFKGFPNSVQYAFQVPIPHTPNPHSKDIAPYKRYLNLSPSPFALHFDMRIMPRDNSGLSLKSWKRITTFSQTSVSEQSAGSFRLQDTRILQCCPAVMLQVNYCFEHNIHDWSLDGAGFICKIS